MRFHITAGLLTACLLTACRQTVCQHPVPPSPTMKNDFLKEFQTRAAKFNSAVALPVFETTTNEIAATVKKTIADGNAALDRIGQLAPAEVGFNNTLRALDDMESESTKSANRLNLIKETSTELALRDAATDGIKELEEWSVGLDYREDVYRAVKAYADTKPALAGEDAKLLEDTMRSYRRAGLALPKAERDVVEHLRKEVALLATDFEQNINKAHLSFAFARAELDGCSADFLDQIRTNDTYVVKVNVTWHYLAVQDNCKVEATRKKLFDAQNNLCRAENIPLLEKILVLRDDIAKKLGYATWGDYQTEVKMVKTGTAAKKFLEELKTGLQPKFDAELAEFRAIKAAQTGDANAVVNIWDWRFCANELKKQKYNVDADLLRVYFPYQHTLDGMFAIYQRIFGLKFELVEAPYKWIADLQLYAVSDSATGEPMGFFYLDMFPRDGKYHHFAQFGLIDGKVLPDGRYQRPTACLVCNFPAPTKDKPSLMSHDEVETLFHEFGHAMHTILTRAKYARFSGTSVPGDFVEAPSQMLEHWVWDKKVLDSFAADYRDPSKKIPAEILAKLQESKLATEGSRYRRQLSFSLLDMTLHTEIHAANASEALPLSNKVLSDVFLPVPPDSAFVAYFGHLMGYDAGYYGYAWADAIAADMGTIFEHAPDGYFDKEVGMKLRREIYAPGDSRDVNISIEKFLGRTRSIEPFLKQIGIGK